MEKIKKLFMFQLPAWVLILSIFASFYIANVIRVKPPKIWAKVSAVGLERLYEKSMEVKLLAEKADKNLALSVEQYSDVVVRYVILQLVEYKHIYRMFYGDEVDVELQRVIDKIGK